MKNHCSIPEPLRYWLALLSNLLLAYLVYMLCRVAFVWENWSLFSPSWNALSLSQLLKGSLRFDTSAIIYTNLLYLVMMLLPLGFTRRNGWQRTAKILFVAVNSIAVIANLCDAVYSQFTGRRTTSSFFKEFSNDDNLGNIIGIELLNHWYLFLVGLLLIAALWFLYRQPKTHSKTSRKTGPILANIALFIAAIPLCVIGMRGGASTAIRPITLSNANQYVNRPAEAAIVLNTPFCVIRTLGKTTFHDPNYFNPDELNRLFSPIHNPSDNTPTTQHDHPNIVILIVESFASEYIGTYNDYKGHTPFFDSLANQSLYFVQSFANGRKSIDGMPSVLSSIPMFVEPFFLTNYSLNEVTSIAEELKHLGYQSAFFHGAENGSMGFEAYARTAGFDQYYGRTQYEQDRRFGGNKDFDGTWAIWDEEFLQFFALTMNTLQQPFVTSLFTASSHHPFVVPEKYQHLLHEDGHPMYTCIRYTDQSLRKFFDTARKQPWFNNTIFVITADHTNLSEQPAYANPMGLYRVPILFYDPSGRMPRGRIENIVAQQIDIMPTLLDFVGYPYPYLAFGKNLLASTHENAWILNYNNGIYQYLQNDTLTLFDGTKSTTYNYRDDPNLYHPLPSQPDNHQTKHLKAIIQSYMQRMIDNKLK